MRGPGKLIFLKVQDAADIAALLLVAVPCGDRVRFDRDSKLSQAFVKRLSMKTPQINPRRGTKKDVDPLNRPF